MQTEFVITVRRAAQAARHLSRESGAEPLPFGHSAADRARPGQDERASGEPSQKIKPGDRIAFDTPKAEPLELKGEAIPLEISHEDDHLLVLNKPAVIVVHPAPGNWAGTLVNALLYHFEHSGGTVSTIGGKERPGLVHRLDKQTSGVMVIAKRDQGTGILPRSSSITPSPGCMRP